MLSRPLLIQFFVSISILEHDNKSKTNTAYEEDLVKARCLNNNKNRSKNWVNWVADGISYMQIN